MNIICKHWRLSRYCKQCAHTGLHCAGLCEGAAYLIKIRRLQAREDRMRQALKAIRTADSKGEARRIANGALGLWE